MKRPPYSYPKPIAFISITLEDGEVIYLPIFHGILKHLKQHEIVNFLHIPSVARKYTREALRVCPWHILRDFPEPWLRSCLEDSNIRESRRKAVEHLLNLRNKKGGI
jgi:hypothetical protein